MDRALSSSISSVETNRSHGRYAREPFGVDGEPLRYVYIQLPAAQIGALLCRAQVSVQSLLHIQSFAYGLLTFPFVQKLH